MLKGHTKIELINEDGSKKTVEHDNMITTAVDHFLKSYRGELPPILKMSNNGDSYAKNLFGGIMLFDDTLSSNADEYFIPSTKITGYASQDAYAGLDVARGSFNESESGLQDDGSYKFVWDFTTAQANGKIQSLGLCPNIMGQIGASDSIQTSEMKTFSFIKDAPNPFTDNMLPRSGSTDGVYNYSLIICAIIGDIAYVVNENNIYYNNSYSSDFILNNGGKLVLRRFKLGATNVGLGDKVSMARYIDTVEVALPSEFTDVLTSSYGYGAVATTFDATNNKLIVYPCAIKSNIAVNGTTKYCEIELTNSMKTTVYTYTNTTAGVLPYANNDSHYPNSNLRTSWTAHLKLYVCEDYIVSITKKDDYHNMYVTKRADNTQVKEVVYNGNNVINTTSAGCGFCPIYRSGNILVFGLKSSYSISNFPWGIYILDMSTGVAKKTNSTDFYSYNVIANYNPLVWVSNGSYLGYKLKINPFVLTTKNNLDSAVTKTASQSMKITYTLTESGV